MLKTKTKVITKIFGIFAVPTLIISGVCVSQLTYAADSSTNLEVNVAESLAVSISTPTDWATGDVNNFLRNKISVNVDANNADGFVATMTTKEADTDLAHEANRGNIPTLAADATRDSSFPVNRWGYSLTDTDAGDTSSIYKALVGSGSTPITLISNAESHTTQQKNVYFGAKADASKSAGTYTSTVVISVVTGVIDSANPVTPTNPAQPGANDQIAYYNEAPIGGSAAGTTTYTYRNISTSDGTETETTEVSQGNNIKAYDGYVAPQGVISRSSSIIKHGSPLVTGLAITASVAAATGIFFFIVARHKKDDEEESELI